MTSETSAEQLSIALMAEARLMQAELRLTTAERLEQWSKDARKLGVEHHKRVAALQAHHGAWVVGMALKLRTLVEEIDEVLGRISGGKNYRLIRIYLQGIIDELDKEV
jgi:hypothetical protein